MSRFTKTITIAVPAALIESADAAALLGVIDARLGDGNALPEAQWTDGITSYSVINFPARESFVAELEAVEIASVDCEAAESQVKASADRITVYHAGPLGNAMQHVANMGLTRL